MTANPSGQKPEEQQAQTHDRSWVAGDQAYQREQAAKLGEAVARGDVDPADLPEAPPPLSWT